MLGDNLKVHFAGSEQIHFGLIANHAGVKYFLFTILPFICNEFGIKHYGNSASKQMNIPKKICEIGEHVIMDSGLFTLMFGSKAGKYDEYFLEKWMDALARTVLESNLNCTCVEVDCQKVLGVEQAWRFREKLKRMLPNNRIINVFHFDDGRKGLDKLIEYTDYIALSVPEFRILKRGNHKEEVYKMASYVKNKKPEIDIHLLGCTENEILKNCKFCTTSDSTSWLSINRYGRMEGNSVRDVNYNRLKDGIDASNKILDLCKMDIKPIRVKYLARYYLSAKYHKDKYTQIAGCQD